MNEYAHIKQAEAELVSMTARELKGLRKSVRKLIMRDLQRRAITGEPSLLGRAQ